MMKVIPLNPPFPVENSVFTEQEVLPASNNAFHLHKEMQISLILKGEGMLRLGSYSQPYKAREVYVIGANQPHVFIPDASGLRSDEDACAIHLYFDFKRIPETFFLLQEMSSIRKFISSCITGLQLVHDEEDKAAALIRKVSIKTSIERLLGLLEIFHYFSGGSAGWKPLSTRFDHYTLVKSEGNRMNDVFRYTLDNYADNITLNKIAAVAHITPHAFCKYFKQHTKKTYNNFLNEVRVNEACKKIISGSYDGLSTIAYKTGFKGASNFNRVFKKTTGMSPSDYKKEFR